MGMFWSSSNAAEALEMVEGNVFELIMKIKEEEGVLDYDFSQQIIKALHLYKKQIDKESKKKNSFKNKAKKLKEMIDIATKSLQALETKKVNPRTISGPRDAFSIRRQLEEIEKRLSNSKHTENDLKMVTACAQSFSRSHQPIKQDEEDAISVLFLEIFLKIPKMKMLPVLTSNLDYLDSIIENFEMINMKKFDLFTADETKSILAVMKSKTEIVNDLIGKALNEMESSTPKRQDSTGAHSSHGHKKDKSLFKLQKINEDLDGYDTIIEQLYPPVREETVTKLKNQIIKLGELNENVKAKESAVMETKSSIRKKYLQILNKLKNIDNANKEINENLKELKKVEEELNSTIKSNFKYLDKKYRFEKLTRDTNSIGTNTSYSEINNRKIDIANKIYGCLMVAAINHLRELNKTLDRHQMDADQFAFPKRLNMYVDKRQEISSLVNYFNDLPNDPCIVARVDFYNKKILEILDILDKKSNANEEIVSALEQLDNIDKEIAYGDLVSTFSYEKLNQFNEFRKRIGMIDHGSDSRILTKKLEIITLLHHCEEKILVNWPSDIQTLKMILNEHEKNVQHFTHPTSSQNFYDKERELRTLQAELYRSNMSDDIRHIFCKTLELIWSHLQNQAQFNESLKEGAEHLRKVAEGIDSLIKFASSLDHKVQSLQLHESTLKAIKIRCKGSETLKEIATLEGKIIAEKDKIELVVKNGNLKQLMEDMNQLTHPINFDTFKEKVNEILLLKESVEDMSDHDQGFDTQKQAFLQEICNTLQRLDEFVAKIAFSCGKKSKPILELHGHFNDFNPNAFDVPKNSVEFVQIIYARAKSFEDRVKYYLGASDSVEYYVIHENLVRLLEELDQLSCADDEDLLMQVVEAMNYIKTLTKKLNSNSSDD